MQVLRVVRLEPGRDLGEAGVACDERRRARGGCLGGDHPERLGEDRGNDGDVGEREQVHEVTMLERTGEKRPGRCERLQRVAVGPESDDHEPRIDVRHRLEQDLHALLLDQLAEVDDRRLLGREERCQARRVALVRQTFLGVRRIGPILACLVDQRRERRAPLLEDELVDVDAGGHLDHTVDVADDLLEDGPDVVGADERRIGMHEQLGTPALELGAPAHRVLELGAVRLDAKRHAADGSADGGTKQDVVRKYQVGRQQLAQSSRVRLDVGLPFGDREVLQQPRLETRVAVEHEHGQQAAGKLRVDDGRAAEVVPFGLAVLADDDHVVPRAAPLPSERPRVDVRPGSAEQVAVPDENPHPAEATSDGNTKRATTRPRGSRCARSRRRGRPAGPRSS